ncbi:sda1 domain-containing protein [Neofusicoccum parvum]|uniref:Protein SDA1 n=1 Tax=Botryosphaeria parva (strain UCR-NP2) TaxID=1287680 RepID=R1EV86_BOTPV|nr:putative sda1 domain-containing protein [Neofusicoccum parvum UCRNP2]GME58600.1 sda1 domain-containing protein [Neofusicoccum parvum]
MGKRKVGALEKVEADLANLQYKVRRDPSSYEDDFRRQYNQYEVFRDVFMQDPTSRDENGLVSLRDHIDFVSHCADCYPKLTATLPDDLITLLNTHHAELETELRDKIVGSLVLLRNKDVIDSPRLLNTLFPILVSTPSKSFRALLFSKILSDLRSSNAKTTNHRLNRTMQTVLFNLLSSDRTSPKGLWAVKLTRELWKRQIWTDAKAVEIMKEAALSENEKVIIGGVRFFLGGDKEREEAAEDEDSEDEIDMGKLKHQVGINKKTKKKDRELKKAAAMVKKKERKKKSPHPLNFSALHLLHDPQGFAEALFTRHLQNAKSKLNLEQKLFVLNLVTRLVGLHQLTIISLYSYFLKFLTPKQPSVTSFLAALAQATHSLVPPDALEPLVQKIANEFVSEAAAAEVASAGLNAIREICARQPLAMNDTLLQDLVMYRKSKDKGTMMAAKGLLSLYREVGADMLKKRDRGKEAAMGLRSGERKEKRFGEVEVGGIEGLDLLEKWKEEERRKRRIEKGLDPDGPDDEEGAEDEDWNNWDVESDADSDDSGGWINVEPDGEDIVISDSEDEKPPAKKTKTSNTTEKPEKTEDPEADAQTAKEKEEAALKLATTRILTPADLQKLQELRLQAQVNSHLPAHRRANANGAATRHSDDPLTAEEIEGLAILSHRRTKEENIALAKAGKEEKHQSTTARRKEKKVAEGKSTTNKEKARKKNFLMTLGKAKSKNKRSLTDTRKALIGHIDRQKRGGKRGNYA